MASAFDVVSMAAKMKVLSSQVSWYLAKTPTRKEQVQEAHDICARTSSSGSLSSSDAFMFARTMTLAASASIIK